jgi:hypothetical protein
MNILLCILDWIGRWQVIVPAGVVALGFVLWISGIAPVLWRLGNGLSKRKVVIFASADNLGSLKSLLLDSRLFSRKNIIDITIEADIDKAASETMFLVHWPDFAESIDRILDLKSDGSALIIYAPRDHGPIPDRVMARIGDRRNTSVTNFRGRLMNDIVTAMITTSYEKR